MIDAEAALEFEHSWDLKLGGFGTRPYRELLAYTGGCLMRNGASAGDVVDYLRTLLEKFAATIRAKGASA